MDQDQAQARSPLVRATGISKKYGRPFSPLGLVRTAFDAGFAVLGFQTKAAFLAVQDLTFNVKAGGIVGFLGPNGAGKTTTLKMILGLLKPTGGTVELFGKPLRLAHRFIFERVGALVDKPNFYHYLSGRSNLELKARLYPRVAPERIDTILSLMDLSDAADRRVATYSTGMKQRLGIATAMLHEPELLILDEPTRGLDPRGQAEVRSLLKRVAEEGKTTILLSSHLLHEVEQVCTSVIIIDSGRRLFEGPVSDLLEGERETVLVAVDKVESAMSILDATDDVEEISREGRTNRLRVVISGGAPRLADLLVHAGIKLHELTLVRHSLEDFFLKITARESITDGNT